MGLNGLETVPAKAVATAVELMAILKQCMLSGLEDTNNGIKLLSLNLRKDLKIVFGK